MKNSVRKCRLSLFAATLSLYALPVVAQEKEQRLEEIVVESTGLGQTLSEQLQPVTVLSGDDLDMKVNSSLGDTLALEPGITSSSFGPGAGRPVIRGLDGDRIRVLENGVGTNDLSAASPDHAVTIDPSLIDKVEVVRGPASLLYGTSAVGGIVNTFDNRIPEYLPEAPAQGTVEVRGDSASQMRTGLMSVTAPVGNVALHVDALASKSDDYHIPGYARTGELRATTPIDYPEPQGTLSWSDTQTDVLTGGGSYIFNKGYIGASFNDYKTIYGVPNGEPDISIDAHRRRADFRAGVRDTGEFIESGTVRAGYVDYEHTEFEGEDAGTYFTNNGLDSRIDLKHKEVGGVRGTWGAQFQANDVDAIGEEAFQPPSTTDVYSLFALEEFSATEDLTLQTGLRYDWNESDTQGFDRESSDDNMTRQYDLFSQSVGAILNVTNDYAVTWSTAYTERAPNAQELFADGPHVATGAFEIGDPSLNTEQSLGTDIALRKTEGDIRGSIGGFYNRFWNYIYANPTGETEDDLPVYQFENVPADFWGFESQVAYYLEDTVSRELSFDFQPDYVWANNRDTHEYLPRIPPLRMKFGATYYNEDLFRVRLELQQVFAQDKVASNETTTDGYSMLNLYLSKDVNYQGRTYELFVRGTNLLSEKVRNHVSYIKDVAPLPGASAMAGIRVRF
jgi:iron complex outermembrane receptor protein